jgi:hypothetical protein
MPRLCGQRARHAIAPTESQSAKADFVAAVPPLGAVVNRAVGSEPGE